MKMPCSFVNCSKGRYRNTFLTLEDVDMHELHYSRQQILKDCRLDRGSKFLHETCRPIEKNARMGASLIF